VLGIALLVASLPLFAAPHSLQGQENPQPPPGLVLVKGGRTKIGSDVKYLEDLILAREELKNTLASEGPLHVEEVAPFFLMPTEVTNEQYAQFVKVSGIKPPSDWGEKALQAGALAFLEEQNKAKQEAKAAGLPFENKLFDREAWWEKHWQEVQWEIPASQEQFPAVYVDYANAQAYAHWAGLRLMTEQEYQRAGRGDSDRIYPWGDEWKDKCCQSLHSGMDKPVAVGSFPDGAVDGIFDLVGNVWEWTSSPFTPYPGNKPISVKTRGSGKRTIEGIAPFDPNERVVVGGSFQMDKIGVRLGVRKNSARIQATSALGFRCAASTIPGVDAANWIVERELTLSFLGDSSLKTELSTALRRWSSIPGTVKVPGYAVITGYENVLLTPVEKISGSSPGDLTQRTTKDGPVTVGVISLPKPLKQPLLDAGTYFIGWRGAGKLAEAKPEENPKEGLLHGQESDTIAFYQLNGFDPEQDCFIFYNREGEPQAVLPAPPTKVEKLQAGAIKIEPFVPPDPKSLPKGAPPPTPIDTLRFTIAVPSASSRGKSFLFDLPIQVAPGSYDSSWK